MDCYGDSLKGESMQRKKATELQIQIDDVYACLGQCAGCILSSGERKSARPDMSPEILALAISRLSEYAASLRPLHRVNLTFGIADHLLMDEAYVADLHALGAAVVEAGEPSDRAHSAVFFTTSLVGRKDAVVGRLRRLRAAGRHATPLLPLVVLDPRLLMAAKFGPAWREMVIEAKSLFGKVDLSINLSDEAVSLMTPAELVAFAEANSFDEVTVNWTPTLANAQRTLGDVGAVRDWLMGFDDLLRDRPQLGTSYRPVIERTVESLMCQDGPEGPTTRAAVEALVPETLAKSIEIDHHGNLLPKFEAVGDIPHAERFGLRHFGHLSEGPIAELIERGMPRVMARVLAIHAQGACATCPHSAICAGTGFHVSTHVMRRSGLSIPAGETGCPHVALPLIERIRAERVAADAARAA